MHPYIISNTTLYGSAYPALQRRIQKASHSTRTRVVWSSLVCPIGAQLHFKGLDLKWVQIKRNGVVCDAGFGERLSHEIHLTGRQPAAREVNPSARHVLASCLVDSSNHILAVFRGHESAQHYIGRRDIE